MGFDSLTTEYLFSSGVLMVAEATSHYKTGQDITIQYSAEHNKIYKTISFCHFESVRGLTIDLSKIQNSIRQYDTANDTIAQNI